MHLAFRAARVAAILATPGLAVAQEAAPKKGPSKTPLELFWSGGLRAESADGRFKLRLRARFENDWAFMDSSSAVEAATGELTDGTEMRRVRLGLEGRIYERIPFKAQVDFAGGEAELRSVYAGVTRVPVVGNVRVGYQREPMGLERNTGTHYVTFMERASANALTPGRNTGILIHDSAADDRLSWAAGFFRETNDLGFGQADDGLIGTARFTGIPWTRDADHFVHVGVAVSLRQFEEGMVRLRARPGLHLAPQFVDTDTVPADDGVFVAFEGLWMHGSTSVQAEHFEARLGGTPAGAGDAFQASYVQVAHFLTGESRRFDRSYPGFKRVRPKGDGGAWELAAQVSRVDLDDGATAGGTMVDYTLGLNWHVNENVRVMSNLIYADLEDVGGALLYGMRFGIDF